MKLRKYLRRVTARQIARAERLIGAWNGHWVGDVDFYLNDEKVETAWPSARYQIKDFVKHTVLKQERVIKLDQKIRPGDIIKPFAVEYPEEADVIEPDVITKNTFQFNDLDYSEYDYEIRYDKLSEN